MTPQRSWPEPIELPDELVTLIAADVIASLGWPREEAEEFVRATGRCYTAGEPQVITVAEAVQQCLHDDRVDTSWPSCPDHPHHPLSLTVTLPALWTCPTTGRVVCPLGDLSTVLGV